MRLALHLLYATGLRLSEIVAAKFEDLQWVEYPSDAIDEEPLEGHVLRVVGKGQRIREVPMPQEVIDELLGYMGGRGLASSNMTADGNAHLLGKAADAGERPSGLVGRQLPVDARQGIAATTLYDQIKAFFKGCSMQLLQRGDAKGAARFAKASTHWLRHTHASHAIAGGMPIEVAQQNLGHASLATTTVYVRTEERRRMKAGQPILGGESRKVKDRRCRTNDACQREAVKKSGRIGRRPVGYSSDRRRSWRSHALHPRS